VEEGKQMESECVCVWGGQRGGGRSERHRERTLRLCASNVCVSMCAGC